MCLETSCELMTWQRMIFILLEMNVLVVLISSIFRFKGYYQLMLVSTLTFLRQALMCSGFFSPHGILLVEVVVKQHQKFSKSQVRVTSSLVMFLPKLWRKTTCEE